MSFPVITGFNSKISAKIEDTSKIIQQEEKVSGNNEVTDTNSQQDEKED